MAIGCGCGCGCGDCGCFSNAGLAEAAGAALLNLQQVIQPVYDRHGRREGGPDVPGRLHAPRPTSIRLAEHRPAQRRTAWQTSRRGEGLTGADCSPSCSPVLRQGLQPDDSLRQPVAMAGYKAGEVSEVLVICTLIELWAAREAHFESGSAAGVEPAWSSDRRRSRRARRPGREIDVGGLHTNIAGCGSSPARDTNADGGQSIRAPAASAISCAPLAAHAGRHRCAIAFAC